MISDDDSEYPSTTEDDERQAKEWYIEAVQFQEEGDFLQAISSYREALELLLLDDDELRPAEDDEEDDDYVSRFVIDNDVMVNVIKLKIANMHLQEGKRRMRTNNPTIDVRPTNGTRKPEDQDHDDDDDDNDDVILQHFGLALNLYRHELDDAIWMTPWGAVAEVQSYLGRTLWNLLLKTTSTIPTAEEATENDEQEEVIRQHLDHAIAFFREHYNNKQKKKSSEGDSVAQLVQYQHYRQVLAHALRQKGELLQWKGNAQEDALKVYEEAHQIDPSVFLASMMPKDRDNIDGSSESRVSALDMFYELGRQDEEIERFDAAIQLYRRALQTLAQRRRQQQQQLPLQESKNGNTSAAAAAAEKEGVVFSDSDRWDILTKAVLERTQIVAESFYKNGMEIMNEAGPDPELTSNDGTADDDEIIGWEDEALDQFYQALDAFRLVEAWPRTKPHKAPSESADEDEEEEESFSSGDALMRIMEIAALFINHGLWLLEESDDSVEWKEALYSFRKAHTIYKKEGDQTIVSKMMEQIGNVAMRFFETGEEMANRSREERPEVDTDDDDFSLIEEPEDLKRRAVLCFQEFNAIYERDLVHFDRSRYDPIFVTSCTRIGELLLDLENSSEALSSFYSSLSVLSVTDSLPRARTLYWMGVAHKEQDETKEALESFQEAGRICQRHEDDPSYLSLSSDLMEQMIVTVEPLCTKAEKLKIEGKAKESLVLYCDALEFVRDSLPPDSIMVSNILRNVEDGFSSMRRDADEQMSSGDWVGPLGLYDDLFQLSTEKNLDENHVVVEAKRSLREKCIDLMNKANEEQELGRYATAEYDYELALQVCVRIEQGSKMKADILYRLGVLQQQSGRVDDDIRYFKDAMHIYSKVAPMSLNYAKCLQAMGKFHLYVKGTLSLALDSFDEALSIQEESSQSDPLDIATSLYFCALVREVMGQTTDALKRYEKATVIRAELSPESPMLAQCYESMAFLHVNLDPVKAKDCWWKSLQILTTEVNSKSFGPSHPRVITCKYNLGKLELNARNFDEAVEHADYVIENLPEYKWAYPIKAKALIGMGRLQDALTVYDEIILEAPNYGDAHAGRFDLLVQLKREADLERERLDEKTDDLDERISTAIKIVREDVNPTVRDSIDDQLLRRFEVGLDRSRQARGREMRLPENTFMDQPTLLEAMMQQLSAMQKEMAAFHKKHSEDLEAVRRENEEIRSVLVKEFDRVVGALAQLSTGVVSPCPHLVWIIPKSTDAMEALKEPREWLPDATAKSKRDRLRKKRVNVFFVCQHSYTTVDPPVEMEVTREWMKRIAPILKRTVSLLKLALGVGKLCSGLPFPIPDIELSLQVNAFDTFAIDFLDKDTLDNIVNVGESLAEGQSLDDLRMQRTTDVVGEAYEVLAEKALNADWSSKMTAVLDEDGRQLWVKNEFVEEYRSSRSQVENTTDHVQDTTTPAIHGHFQIGDDEAVEENSSQAGRKDERKDAYIAEEHYEPNESLTNQNHEAVTVDRDSINVGAALTNGEDHTGALTDGPPVPDSDLRKEPSSSSTDQDPESALDHLEVSQSDNGEDKPPPKDEQHVLPVENTIGTEDGDEVADLDGTEGVDPTQTISVPVDDHRMQSKGDPVTIKDEREEEEEAGEDVLANQGRSDQKVESNPLMDSTGTQNEQADQQGNEGDDLRERPLTEGTSSEDLSSRAALIVNNEKRGTEDALPSDVAPPSPALDENVRPDGAQKASTKSSTESNDKKVPDQSIENTVIEPYRGQVSTNQCCVIS